MCDATVQLQVILRLRRILWVNEYFFGLVSGSRGEGMVDFCDMGMGKAIEQSRAGDGPWAGP